MKDGPHEQMMNLFDFHFSPILVSKRINTYIPRELARITLSVSTSKERHDQRHTDHLKSIKTILKVFEKWSDHLKSPFIKLCIKRF